MTEKKEFKNINEVLHFIQTNLKAPKDKYNSFGRYSYRSAEGILEAVKNIIPEEYNLIINDEIINIGERFYIKATAKLFGIGENNYIEVSAFAREEESKKGMDGSQVTGACSSYARKYALNGLFCIDDTKDTDTEEFQKQNNKNKKEEEKEDIINFNQIKEIGDLGFDLKKLNEFIKEHIKKDANEIKNLNALTERQAVHIIEKIKEINKYE